MAYEVTLTDSTTSWTSPTPNTPLAVQTIEAASEVTTLDLNVYVDLFGTKKMWTITWGYMSKTDYAQLRAFYDRQFTNLEFPTVAIPDLNIEGVVVKSSLSDQNITDESGLVENVELTLRETVQSTASYTVS